MAGSGKALVLHVLLCCLCGGIANIKCSGYVWIEPAPVVQMGSNISINCLSTLGCPWTTFFVLVNYSRAEGPLQPLNSSTMQLQLHNFRMPSGSITCFACCPNSERICLVCGADVWAGYPPDPPSNLICSIREHSGHLGCMWDAGQLTHLPTNYTLHLRSVRMVAGEDAVDAEEEKVFPAGSPVPLSALHGRSHYSAWVQASNALGTSRSAPRHLNLQELVVPTLPLVVGAETMESSPLTTTIYWRRQTLQENVYCEERHKATGASAWHVEAWDDAVQHRPRSQHKLQSNTQYVFQVRCRLSPAHSPWSSWSTPFLYTTPEAAPATAPDVWQRLGPAFPNGSHEVMVLIKPLSPQDARGRILGYTVATKSPEGALLLCNTSGVACSVLVPPGARTLHVTAHNSKGASRPANITLNQATSSQEEFPAPVAVEVKFENQSRISVTWQPPHHSGRSPLWFIVEWVFTTPYSQEEQYFWKKVPYQETHTYIQEEGVAGDHINVSVYAVYPNGVSKPSSGRVPSEEQLLGSTYSEITHDENAGVFLGLGVSMVVLSVVFLVLTFKKSARKSKAETNRKSKNHSSIKASLGDVIYHYTGIRKGRKERKRNLCRIKAAVVSLLPKWLLEDFPHMENSNAVKSLQEKSGFTSNSFCELFLDTSDPTVMEIEEVPVHKEYKNVATRKKPSREVPKDEEHLGSTAPTSIMAPEQISDYKPQVSDGNQLGYVAANIYQTELPTALPELETSIFFRDYTSPIPHLWDAEGEGHHVFLLDKINLVLNNSQSGQSQVFGSAQGVHSSLLETQWEHMLASDVQEQTLVPDELVSSLRAMNGESVEIKTCFPQSIGRLF